MRLFDGKVGEEFIRQLRRLSMREPNEGAEHRTRTCALFVFRVSVVEVFHAGIHSERAKRVVA